MCGQELCISMGSVSGKKTQALLFSWVEWSHFLLCSVLKHLRIFS